jgi:hypothetical protein
MPGCSGPESRTFQNVTYYKKSIFYPINHILGKNAAKSP